MADECAVCGLTAFDLPDGVDPEFVFEVTDGVSHCVVCDPTKINEGGAPW